MMVAFCFSPTARDISVFVSSGRAFIPVVGGEAFCRRTAELLWPVRLSAPAVANAAAAGAAARAGGPAAAGDRPQCHPAHQHKQRHHYSHAVHSHDQHGEHGKQSASDPELPVSFNKVVHSLM